jgi:hypothetical protein
VTPPEASRGAGAGIRSRFAPVLAGAAIVSAAADVSGLLRFSSDQRLGAVAAGLLYLLLRRSGTHAYAGVSLAFLAVTATLLALGIPAGAESAAIWGFLFLAAAVARAWSLLGWGRSGEAPPGEGPAGRFRWGFLALLAVLCLPWVWLQGPYAVRPEEFYFADYSMVWDNFRTAWIPFLGRGSPAAPWNHGMVIPNGVFFKAADAAGLGVADATRIYLALWLAVTMAGLVGFLSIVTRSRSGWVVLGVLAYLLNYYMRTTVFYTAKMFELSLLPLLFVLFVRHLQTRRLRYACLNALALSAALSLWGNLPQALSTVAVYVPAFLFVCLEEGVAPPTLLRREGRRIALFLVFLLPMFLYLACIYGFLVVNDFKSIVSLNRKLVGLTQNPGRAALSLVFQLRGYSLEDGAPLGVPYDPWRGFQQHPGTVLAAYLLMGLALSPLGRLGGMAPAAARRYLLLLTFFLAAAAMASGLTFQPHWYSFLFHHIPGFIIFRDPWTKFMPWVLLSFSALLTVSVLTLPSRSHRVAASVLALTLVLARGYPQWSPRMYDRRNIGWNKMFILEPPSWKAFREWSRSNPETTVLPFPVISKGFLPYRWHGGPLGESNHPMATLTARNSVITLSNLANMTLADRFSLLMDLYWRRGEEAFVRLGPVDYLLDQADLSSDCYGRMAGDQAGVLRSFGREGKVALGDRLGLYPVRPEEYTPAVFAPTRVLFISAQDLTPDAAAWAGLRAGQGFYREADGRGPGDPIRDWVLEQSGVAVASDLDGEGDAFVTVPRDGIYEILAPARDLEDIPGRPPIRLRGVRWSGGGAAGRLAAIPDASGRGARLGTLAMTAGIRYRLEAELDPAEDLSGNGEWIPADSPEGVLITRGWGLGKPLGALMPLHRWKANADYRIECRGGDPTDRLILVEDLFCSGECDRMPRGEGTRRALRRLDFERSGDRWSTRVTSEDCARQAELALLGPAPGGRGLDVRVRRVVRPRYLFRERPSEAPTGRAPEVVFRREDPARYHVEVRDAREPFLLILCQNFHAGWRAVPLGGSRAGVALGERDHLVMNGYANAWRVDPARCGGPDFSLVITYGPRDWFLASQVLWGASLAAFAFLGFLDRRRPVPRFDKMGIR